MVSDKVKVNVSLRVTVRVLGVEIGNETIIKAVIHSNK